LSPALRPLTTVERAIALREVNAFRGVPMEQLAHVAAAARDEWCPAGGLLFEEGDPPGSLYVILHGKISLERNGAVIGEAGENEPLGTWSLFDDHPRRATARIVEDARVLILERDDFYDVLSEHVEVTRSLVQELVRRVMELAGFTEENHR